MPTTTTSMRIELTDDQRDRMVDSVQQFFQQEIDHDLSEFQAQRVVAFFIKELGAPVYNKAIRDARGFMLEKLDDLDAEFYESEESYSP